MYNPPQEDHNGHEDQMLYEWHCEQQESYYYDQQISHDHTDGGDYEDDGTDQYTGHSIYEALNALAINENATYEERKDLEEEEVKYTAMVSSSKRFKREELNILNENFSILSRKAEERKRRENLYAIQIIKKRSMLSQDIGRAVQSGLQALNKKSSVNKLSLERNRQHTHLKIIEEKEKIQNWQHQKLKEYYDMNDHFVKTTRNVEMWILEMKNGKNEFIEMNEIFKREDEKFEVVKNKIEQTNIEINTFDLDKITNDIKFNEKKFVVQEEKIKKDISETEELIKSVFYNVDDLIKEQEQTKLKASEKTKIIDLTVEEKDDISTQINNTQSQIQDFHLKKLTLENGIEIGDKKIHLLRKETNIKVDLQCEVETKEIILNNDIEMSRQNEKNNKETIDQIEFIIAEISNQYELMDSELVGNQTSKIKKKEAQNYQKLECKKSEFYHDIVILEKTLKDIESNNSDEEIRFEATRVDFQQDCEKILECNNGLKVQNDISIIDLDNTKCNVTYVQQEIGNGIHKHKSEIDNLIKEIEELDEKSKWIENSQIKTLVGVENDIKTDKNQIVSLQQAMEIHETEVGTLMEKIEEVIEREKNLKENGNKKEMKISELDKEKEVHQLKNTKVSQELFVMQKKCENILLKYENVQINENGTQETYDKYYKELSNVMKQVELKNENIKSLNNLKYTKDQALGVEEINHEKREQNGIRAFEEKINKIDSDLINMQKSYDNKLRIFQSSEIDKLERKRDSIRAKIVSVHKEIETFREKEIELQRKVEKKKAQLKNSNDKLTIVSKVLQDNNILEDKPDLSE